jgi:hypothetical protein
VKRKDWEELKEHQFLNINNCRGLAKLNSSLLMNARQSYDVFKQYSEHFSKQI